MNLKSDMICNICKKFLNEPISLPCHCCICNEHTQMPANKFMGRSIKCLTCRKEYSKVDNFKRNELAEKILRINLHLNDEEKSLKLILIRVLDDTEKSLEHFKMVNSEFETEINKHFNAIQQRIEAQRDDLKNKIDQIASSMIDQVKCKETVMTSDFKEIYSKFTCRGRVSQTKKLLDEFRNPKMVIENIKSSALEQEESLVDLKKNMDKFELKFKNDIESFNFKPNMNTREEELFGCLNFI